ncbi:flagellar protein FlgN [Paenibacillus beijingensis]|uniref:Flagellar biosynthesis protein FlgN n=1 Tax=Paenibacillus beijingensis TaxID=1126833 RepID=A0A0D5NHW6_9BACL|nr:flagellar protein FlgN [Paenibacillus beijingensis]AJY74518.1 hypothetical protein VN24_07940 [Paenibacillus beijingensis]
MSVQAVLETLREQLELYGQLLETAEQKTPVLVKNDIERLNVIMSKERKLVQKADELELRRSMLTNTYFSRLSLRLRSGKLSDMIRTVNHPGEKQQLIDIQSELAARLTELQRKNEHNQQLIRQSLDFIEYSLELVVDNPSDDFTYQHPMNRLSGGPRAGLFDTRG